MTYTGYAGSLHPKHGKKGYTQEQSAELTDATPLSQWTVESSHPRLASYRLARGWSQRQLAEMINASEQSIGRWERGEAFPQELFLRRLCSLLNATEEEQGLVWWDMGPYCSLRPESQDDHPDATLEYRVGKQTIYAWIEWQTQKCSGPDLVFRLEQYVEEYAAFRRFYQGSSIRPLLLWIALDQRQERLFWKQVLKYEQFGEIALIVYTTTERYVQEQGALAPIWCSLSREDDALSTGQVSQRQVWYALTRERQK